MLAEIYRTKNKIKKNTSDAKSGANKQIPHWLKMTFEINNRHKKASTAVYMYRKTKLLVYVNKHHFCFCFPLNVSAVNHVL